jgi:hypothetical protein
VFHSFIKTLLKKSDKPSILLIGEDHAHSSALIGLAHCLDDFEHTNKKVIVVSEDLKRLQGFFYGEKAYTADLVKNALSPTDSDIDAILMLIERGVTIYGLESKKTAPGLFLTGKTKTLLLQDVVKKTRGFFKMKQLKID